MRLDLPMDVCRRLHDEVRYAGKKEIGGVMMAEQIEPGHFILMDFTVDRRVGDAAHFVRSVDDHREALSGFFARTGSDFGRFNYLGEWHSHPNHPPIPSREDILSMERLVQGEREIDFAVLLIVQAKRGAFELSANLFQRDAPIGAVAIVGV
ncbi:hypothetical protein D3C73_288600 [compost metagenome]